MSQNLSISLSLINDVYLVTCLLGPPNESDARVHPKPLESSLPDLSIVAECRKSEPSFFKRSRLAQIDTTHRVCMAILLPITSSVAVASDLLYCGVIKPVLESFTGLGCNHSNHHGIAGFRVCLSSSDSN
ncbi:hypothetical protein GGI42DRAFT_250064 [Trichoderma sp. SZMC 28013]